MPRADHLVHVLTITEASRQFKLSDGYLRHLLARKSIRGRKANGTWLLDLASLQRFAKTERKRGPKPRVP